MWKQPLLVAALAVLLRSATAPALEPPTFSNEVVRILQTRCQTCHRPGEHAPFSLLTYRDAFEMTFETPSRGGWDFNWQGTYTFTQPVPLPGGTRIDMVAIFDNSAENLRQPSRPPRPVSWGDGTTDEMAIVFVGVTVDGERIGWRPR